jgi:putative sigma-54 modulation protein
MRTYIQTQGFELTAEIDAHVRKQLARNLARSEQNIVAVDVFLGDVNGPKGGEDKKALVCVQLTSRLAVRLEAVHADLYAAIALASRKAKRAVKRTVRKHKRIEKSGLRELRQSGGEFQTANPGS